MTDVQNVASFIHPLIKSGDACVLEFEFNATCGSDECLVEIEYVFASEEYYRGLDAKFRDIFACFLNGQNIALLPNDDFVGISTIGTEKFPELFIENPCFPPDPDSDVDEDGDDGGDDDDSECSNPIYANFQPEGFTTLLSNVATVPNGAINHIRFIIADVSDIGIDSYAFIKSVKGISPPPGPGPVTNCEPGCMGDENKYAVCHNAGDNNYVSLCIPEKAMKTHIEQHGDKCGCCPEDPGSVPKWWC